MELKYELAKALEQQVGLDQAHAEQAAEVAIEFIKDRAPEPVRQYLEGHGLARGLGGLFG